MPIVAQGENQSPVDVWFVAPDNTNVFAQYVAQRYARRTEAAKEAQKGLLKKYDPAVLNQQLNMLNAQIQNVVMAARKSNADAIQVTNKNLEANAMGKYRMASLAQANERNRVYAESANRRSTGGRKGKDYGKHLLETGDAKAIRGKFLEGAASGDLTSSLQGAITSWRDNATTGAPSRGIEFHMPGAMFHAVELLGEKYDAARADSTLPPVTREQMIASMEEVFADEDIQSDVSALLKGNRRSQWIANAVDAEIAGNPSPSFFLEDPAGGAQALPPVQARRVGIPNLTTDFEEVERISEQEQAAMLMPFFQQRLRVLGQLQVSDALYNQKAKEKKKLMDIFKRKKKDAAEDREDYREDTKKAKKAQSEAKRLTDDANRSADKAIIDETKADEALAAAQEDSLDQDAILEIAQSEMDLAPPGLTPYANIRRRLSMEGTDQVLDQDYQAEMDDELEFLELAEDEVLTDEEKAQKELEKELNLKARKKARKTRRGK